MKEIIESIQFVLINPNPKSAQNPNAASEQENNNEAFESHVNQYLDEMVDYDIKD